MEFTVKKFITYSISVILITSLAVLAQEEGKLDQLEAEIARGSGEEDEEVSCVGLEIMIEEIEDDGEETSIEDFFATVDVVAHIFEVSFNVLFRFPELETDVWDLGYTDFPYHHPLNGMYTLNSTKKYSIIAGLNYFQHDRNLSGISFKSRFSPHPFFSLEFGYSNLVEQVGFDYDYLRFYNFFINYNRIKNEYIALWWGIGVKAIGGNNRYTGFGFNLGTEIFPVKPLSVEMRYNLGFLNQTNVSEFALNLNCHIKRFKFYVGYQNFSAGRISIGGFTVGAGIYF
jgi:hypothetical protein